MAHSVARKSSTPPHLRAPPLIDGSVPPTGYPANELTGSPSGARPPD